MSPRTIIAIVVVAFLAIIGVAIYGSFQDREPVREQDADTVNNPPQTPTASGQLTENARTYTSDQLGILFTYNSRPADNFEVRVTETGNKIYLHGTNERPEQGKMIEVFDKQPSLSLAEAIRQRFLAGINESTCFVQELTRDQNDPRPPTYSFAEISYPPPSDPNAPFWQNSARCPQPYSKTNAVQYFMMNSQVPGKFVFISLGQDSITDDGTVQPEGARRDWSGAVRIIE